MLCLLGGVGVGLFDAGHSTSPTAAATTIVAPAPAALPVTGADSGSPAGQDNQVQPSVPPTIQADPASLEGQRDGAMAMLNAQMANPDGAEFRGVQTVLSGTDASQVNFCGEVNAKDPSGAYQGYQSFISSASSAKLELMMTSGEFADAWRERCSGNRGPQIWQ